MSYRSALCSLDRGGRGYFVMTRCPVVAVVAEAGVGALVFCHSVVIGGGGFKFSGKVAVD